MTLIWFFVSLVWQEEKSRDRKASRHETGIQKVKSSANTSEKNYTKRKKENEKEAGACTDNGSMAVGSGARAGGMGRRGGKEGSRQRRKRDMSSWAFITLTIIVSFTV